MATNSRVTFKLLTSIFLTILMIAAGVAGRLALSVEEADGSLSEVVSRNLSSRDAESADVKRVIELEKLKERMPEEQRSSARARVLADNLRQPPTNLSEAAALLETLLFGLRESQYLFARNWGDIDSIGATYFRVAELLINNLMADDRGRRDLKKLLESSSNLDQFGELASFGSDKLYLVGISVNRGFKS